MIYAAETAVNIVPWENHFYMVVNIVEPDRYYYRWDEAKEYCEQMGGHLATITSEEEQQIISECLENEGEYKQYWLGGYKNENWRSCLEIYNSGLWDDTKNEEHKVKGYICEWEF